MGAWRIIRVLVGLLFIFSKTWLPILGWDVRIYLALRIAGVYIIFIELFVFLWFLKIEEKGKYFERFKFWDSDWKIFITRFDIYAPSANSVYLSGTFNSWGRESLEQDACQSGWWNIEKKLKLDRYEYRFIVDGNWQNIDDCESFSPNPFGEKNCVKIVDGSRSFPSLKISIRTTFIQILIAISGFILAFLAASMSAVTFKEHVIVSILVSIISGLLYSFILSGGVIKETSNKNNEIRIQEFNENWMEICINVQVVALIYGLGLLIKV
jgi:AMP-activated protein kinase-like protein